MKDTLEIDKMELKVYFCEHICILLEKELVKLKDRLPKEKKDFKIMKGKKLKSKSNRNKQS